MDELQTNNIPILNEKQIKEEMERMFWDGVELFWRQEGHNNKPDQEVAKELEDRYEQIINLLES
jgi:hypothetical protein